MNHVIVLLTITVIGLAGYSSSERFANQENVRGGLLGALALAAVVFLHYFLKGVYY